MSFNMCVSMLFLPFSHPEESLFTQSVSANDNGHQGGGGYLSPWTPLSTDNEDLPAGCNCIFIMLRLFHFFQVSSCPTVSLKRLAWSHTSIYDKAKNMMLNGS